MKGFKHARVCEGTLEDVRPAVKGFVLMQNRTHKTGSYGNATALTHFFLRSFLSEICYHGKLRAGTETTLASTKEFRSYLVLGYSNKIETDAYNKFTRKKKNRKEVDTLSLLFLI